MNKPQKSPFWLTPAWIIALGIDDPKGLVERAIARGDIHPCTTPPIDVDLELRIKNWSKKRQQREQLRLKKQQQNALVD